MGKKTFSADCVSLFVRLFLIDIGCFFISFFIFAISSVAAVRAAVQIIDIAIVIAMTYSYCHKVGSLDAPGADSGCEPRKPLKGLWMGLCATIPFIISGVMLVLSKLGLFMSNFLGYFKIINSFYYPFLFSELPVDLSISELMWLDIVIALCVLLIIPILSFFSYLIGLNRISLSELAFYKKKGDSSL